MKKQLLTTTALVAAGAIAASTPALAKNTVSLGVGGYLEQIVGIVFDRDDTNTVSGTTRTSVDQQSESEIHFKGTGKLDNGITIVANVELEVTGSPGNRIDEQYIIVRGNFGQVILGSEDNAGHLMTIGYSGSWATGVGQSLTFDRADWISPPSTYYAGALGGQRFDGTLNDVRLRSSDNDSSKISYFTPRFSGFQIGVSYIPNFKQQTSTASVTVAQKGSAYHEGWALGANFSRKFDKVAIGVAVGYLTAESPGTGSNNTGDMRAYSVGAKVDFAGFRVSLGYKKNEDVYALSGRSNTVSLNGEIFDLGAKYAWGANSVSIGYTTGEMEGSTTVAGDDEEQGLMLSYRRALGPGVRWTANLMYADYDEETGGANSSNDGWAATTTLRLAF